MSNPTGRALSILPLIVFAVLLVKPCLSKDVVYSNYMAKFGHDVTSVDAYWSGASDYGYPAAHFVVERRSAEFTAVDYWVDEIVITVEPGTFFDGDSTVTLDLMTPNFFFGEPANVLQSYDISSKIDEFGGVQRVVIKPGEAPGSFPKVRAGDDYYLRLSVGGDDPAFGPTLSWKLNSAGVDGSDVHWYVYDAFFGSWLLQTGQAPAFKVSGFAVDEPAVKPSYTSYATLGSSSGPVTATLNPEYFCPPRESRFWCPVEVEIPSGASSASICRLVADAINAVPNADCLGAFGVGPPPVPHGFEATCHGVTVRVMNMWEQCSGAYVCADAVQGLTQFLKSLSHENDEVAGELNLAFEGIAAGVAEDPSSANSVRVVHTVRDFDSATDVFDAEVPLTAGMTPEQVVDDLTAALVALGDTHVSDHSDRIAFLPPAAQELVIDQANETTSAGIQIQAFGPLGQGFQTELPYFDAIELRTSDASGGSNGDADLRLTIHDGTLAGPIVATSDIVTLPADWSNPGYTRFNFDPRVQVVPGQTYVWSVEVLTATPWLTVVAEPVYDAGIAYLFGAPDPDSDLWFRLGVLLPGTADIAYKINDTGLGWAMTPFDEEDPFTFFESGVPVPGPEAPVFVPYDPCVSTLAVSLALLNPFREVESSWQTHLDAVCGNPGFLVAEP